MCHSTNLTVGHSYLILASAGGDGEYRSADTEFDASDRRLMRRLMTVCGLQAVYPWGMYSRYKGIELQLNKSREQVK